MIVIGAISAESVEILRKTVVELNYDGTISFWNSRIRTLQPLAIIS